MAKITIEFDTDNAAFDDDVGAEVAAILKRIAHTATSVNGAGIDALDDKPVRDTYGNTVGTITVKEGG